MPLRKLCLTACLFCCLTATALAQDSLLSKSDIIKLDFNTLAEKKNRLREKDPALIPAYRQLLQDADKLLDQAPLSVMQKTAIPPSGDKHDYMSIAPYFWPDPSKPDGLPYIIKTAWSTRKCGSIPTRSTCRSSVRTSTCYPWLT